MLYAIIGAGKNASADVHMNKTAYPVALSIFLNLLWTVVVGADLWVWAYPLQWLMLIISIILLYRWDLNSKPLTVFQKFLSIPFALYAGWLTVAMIPFTADLLNKSGWNYEPFSQVTWGLILYVVACLIILLVFYKLKHPFYLLPLAWALFGYFIRFDNPLKLTAAFLAVFILVVFLIKLRAFYTTNDHSRNLKYN